MSADKPTPKDNPRARPARETVELGERKRRRTHFDASFDQQLPVDESRLDRKNFTYRWFNDIPGRVTKFTKSDDWEPVSAEEAGVPVEHHVGYNRDGASMRAVLMKKPRKWHDEDQARKIALSREDEAQMMRRAPSGSGGGLGAEGYALNINGVRAGTAKLPGRDAPLAEGEEA